MGKEFGETAASALGTPLKIVIGYCQVISSFDVSFQVEWPKAFTDFMAGIAVVNIDIFRTVDFQCESRSYSFNTTFLLTIFLPIVITLVNFVVMLLRQMCGAERAYPQHMKAFLFFLFL